MEAVFYISSGVAIAATALAVTRLQPVHALLCFLVSLFATALIFYVLGAAFAAALEVIIYAGAIVVLFVFVVMMIDVGPRSREQERRWLSPGMWIAPSVLSLVLLVEIGYVLLRERGEGVATVVVEPVRVGVALFGPYVLAVELAAFLLLAGLVGAYHLGKKAEITRAEKAHGERAGGARPRPRGSAVPAGTHGRARAP